MDCLSKSIQLFYPLVDSQLLLSFYIGNRKRNGFHEIQITFDAYTMPQHNYNDIREFTDDII